MLMVSGLFDWYVILLLQHPQNSQSVALWKNDVISSLESGVDYPSPPSTNELEQA